MSRFPADAPGQDAPAVASPRASELLTWTVRLHGIGQEKLGRLAPSLQSLPTVIWESPLGFYLDKSLTEIRELKTHGFSVKPLQEWHA